MAGCDEPPDEPASAEERPGALPAPEEAASDPLEGLTPWSDDWILAHAPSFLDDDPAPRRAALERSLTNRENLYARTRLGAYARGNVGWDALPEWNPPTGRLDAALASAFARGETPPLDARPVWDGTRPTTWEGWRELGERVFFEYPLRSESFFEVALRDPERREELGLQSAPDASLPGLVWMRDIDGEAAVGITCALCHTARDPGSGALIAGRARRRLDYGAIRIAYYDARGAPLDPTTRARWESWGPGRADVLEDVADTPIAITDLYGLRHERRLTQAGTIRHESPLALLIRQETQYIQANHHHTRPPRELMVALAVYLYSIEPPPAPTAQAPEEVLAAGQALYGLRCASCHENAVGAGDSVVAIEAVGTDPELATGAARGTGGYRPTPLVRVADAAPYLHHGAVPTLEELFTEARFADRYAGSMDGPGPVPGHRFGLDLSADERGALLAYLRTL